MFAGLGTIPIWYFMYTTFPKQIMQECIVSFLYLS